MSRTIDAVITWVDGDDPRHRAKRMQYGSTGMLAKDDVAGSTRYNSLGEILYCIASLNRFAPWLNKIYIVTDEQDPKVEEWLRERFPEGYIPMEIVDHKVIFRGYEQYLPTFNSIAIETMTWRIPGLSEHFIEFNDDLILGAPVSPEDFFPTDDSLVCYGRKINSWWVGVSRLLKYRRDGSKKVTFKETMSNAASLLGPHRFFLKMEHTPKGLLRSRYEEFFSAHPEHMLRNISYRFRDAAQFNSQEIQYLGLLREGRCEVRSVKENLFYLKPKSDTAYVERKLQRFSAHPELKFGCFNSLDQASPEGLDMILRWIENRLSLHA